MERIAEATPFQRPELEPTRKPGASIASVTVAYNGASVIREHLECLKRQTVKLDEIIVLDNASTDKTLTLLGSEYPDVTILQLQQNCGVGGGLAAGISYAARRQQHDWIWIFDQDSLPEAQCLERLLDAHSYVRDEHRKTAVVAPICVHPQTGMMCHGLSWVGDQLLPTALNPSKPVTLVDSVISSGSLIAREAIEVAGLPRADFFMDFVDHEYCLRLRRCGFAIAVARDGCVGHTLGEPAKLRFFGRTKYWSDHAPWREYYMTRNEIFTMWKYYPRIAVKGMTLYRLAWHAAGIFIFGKRKLECLRMMFRGFIDGRAGRLGVHRFIPGSLQGMSSSISEV